MVGIHEVETGEETYYKEENERIGEGEEKSCTEVFPVSRAVYGWSLQFARRIAAEKIQAVDHKDCRADHLEYRLVGLYEVCDHRQSQAGKEAIDNIAQRGADPGEERRPSSLIQCPLDTEHPYRPHWRRNQHSDKEACEHYGW